MNDSLRLSVPDLNDPAQRAGFFEVADAALDVDGFDPFNEQARLDVGSGRRTPIVATAWSQDEHARPIGSAIVGRGELDLVIHPLFRGKGYGEIAVRGLLSTARGSLTAWSHGDHPAARILADHHGFLESRTLYRLRLAPLPQPSRERDDRFESFRPGADEEEWVALNALIFANHPEQGQLTVDDLRAREAESWFCADDFLIARDGGGRMIGYNWLKIGDEPDGEIYVLGIHPEFAGHGLGRALMNAGLDRIARRERHSAVLYVDESNANAVHLYRALGFATDTTDVQFTRIAAND